MIGRRDFITLLGGAIATWPLAARAQQPERMRRIGVLMILAADDPEAQLRTGAFLQGLQDKGWSLGRNLQIDYRWAPDVSLYPRYASELLALGPEVILASGAGALGAVQQATRTVPIVFVAVTDPVGAGFVASLARPGGNATGFINFEYGMTGKWLELLKQLAPRTTRVAVFRDSNVANYGTGIGQLAAIQSVAPSLGVELVPLGIGDVAEMERALTGFVRGPDDGLIVTNGAFSIVNRDSIVGLAARHRLPAVYPFRLFATAGGLLSYGNDRVEQYRRAAGYVDRILRGEKAADLPVQAPTKYELVINLKTAKTLGLAVPANLLAIADEVIE